MINPFDDSWQYGQVDSSTAYGCSPMDPTYAPEASAAGLGTVEPYGSELTQPERSISGSLMADPYSAPEHTTLASQDPAYTTHHSYDLTHSGHMDPLNSPLNPMDPMQTSSPVHLDHWQPHSWDYTTSSFHSELRTVSQTDPTQLADHLVDRSSMSSYDPFSDPMTAWSSTQDLTDNSHTYSLASAPYHAFASHCRVTSNYSDSNVWINYSKVGSHNGNTFYWNNGHLAGTWNCNNHHAYGPNGHDLGYAGSWYTAAQLIYQQQY